LLVLRPVLKAMSNNSDRRKALPLRNIAERGNENIILPTIIYLEQKTDTEHT